MTGFVKQYVVDSFTDKIFHGNQAAVCVIGAWLPEEILQEIAKENNFSETAFVVKDGEKFHLRWFTLGGEIDLCGHATLASAFVLSKFYRQKGRLAFKTLSGGLTVMAKGEMFEMEFPAYDLKKVEVKAEIKDAIGVAPCEAYMGRDLLCVLDDEETVRNLSPDMEKLRKLDGLLLHVTARGENFDSVSRSFAPKLNVPEDPVCGSGHCHIAPYWSKRLGKKSLVAYQASRRGGTLHCRVEGEKVFLAGNAALFSVCDLNI